MTSQEILKTEIFNKKCSLFKNAKSTTPIQTISIKEWFEYCKLPQTKNDSDICREEFRLNGKSERYDELKRKVKCGTLSGTFSYRANKNLIENNGLLVIDIDHPNMDLNELKEHIISFFGEYLFSISISLSGDGLYCIVPIDTTKNREKLFEKIQKIFLSKDIKIDGGCKDLVRLRIMSYDEDVWFNPNDEIKIFNEELELSEVEKDVQYRQFIDNREKYTKYSLLNDDNFVYACVAIAIRKFNYTSNSIDKNYYRWWSCLNGLASLGYKGLDLALELSRQSSGYISDSDVVHQFELCLRKGGDREWLGRFFKPLKDEWGDDWIKMVRGLMEQTSMRG